MYIDWNYEYQQMKERNWDVYWHEFCYRYSKRQRFSIFWSLISLPEKMSWCAYTFLTFSFSFGLLPYAMFHLICKEKVKRLWRWKNGLRGF